jgi:hypothetical protein
LPSTAGRKGSFLLVIELKSLSSGGVAFSAMASRWPCKSQQLVQYFWLTTAEYGPQAVSTLTGSQQKLDMHTTIQLMHAPQLFIRIIPYY